TISAWNLLFGGACVIAGTLGISLFLRHQIHKLPAHKSMLNVAEVIFQTCKTYLIQQGKFLLMLFAIIAVSITFYLLSSGQETTEQLTDRTVQELRLYPPVLKNTEIPDDVVAKLQPLINKKPAEKQEFIKQLSETVGSENWTKYGSIITEIAAPEHMPVLL